jgi:hypothetical protein
MPELAMTRIQGAVERMAEIVGGDDAEGADGSQRARLGAAEGVVVAVVVDVLSLEAARQIDVLHEHVPPGRPAPAHGVRAAAASAAEVARAIIALAWVVTPTRVVHRPPPSETSAFSHSRCRPTELPVQFVAGPRNHLNRHDEVACFGRPRCLLGDSRHRGQIPPQLDPQLAPLRSQDDRLDQSSKHF